MAQATAPLFDSTVKVRTPTRRKNGEDRVHGEVINAKTMGRWGRALGAQVIKQIHERIVQIAQAHEVSRALSLAEIG